MKFVKFVICMLSFCTVFSTVACAKPKQPVKTVTTNIEVKTKPATKDKNISTKNETQVVIKEEEKVKTTEEKVITTEEKVLSADEKKLEAVMNKMSKRFINDFNKSYTTKEFLADLQKVLEQDKKLSEGDISLLYLIDKTHNIGSDYVPNGLVKLETNKDYICNKTTLSLRPIAASALRELAQGAMEDGVKLDVSSTYRSYSYQKSLFQHWVDVDGLAEAERESARAGTSQHQLGVAIDFGSISDDYDRTAGGKWMYANASDFGWSLSFPKGYEDVTGFKWECWHFRYIGTEACKFQKKYFNNVQQYMIEFVDAWRNYEE